jgi:hypothetical protein
MMTFLHFWSYLAEFLLAWQMFQTKVVQKIKNPHFMLKIFFIKSCRLWKKCGKNIVEPGRSQMTIWRMHIACWITTVISIHSECVILNAFPPQQWLRERATILNCSYSACFVLSFFLTLFLTEWNEEMKQVLVYGAVDRKKVSWCILTFKTRWLLHIPPCLEIKCPDFYHKVYVFNYRKYCECGARGGAVVKALHYKPAGRGFDSRWCHWNFSVT